MKHSFNISFIILMGLVFVTTACIEELDTDSAVADEGKGMLVVEATFNDKLERQRVYLSRSDTRFDLETDTIYSYVYPLGIGSRDSINVEQNARIILSSDSGQNISFKEEEPGTYLSSQAFALQLNQEYHLDITTSNGKEYSSDSISMVNTSEIEDITVRAAIDDFGVEGILISVDSKPNIGNPSLFRYTYEETFKIIVPEWNSQDFLLTNYDPCAIPVQYDLNIINRTIQNEICYKTVPSNTIIQNNVTDNFGNVNSFPVRFIALDNFITTHRYSILVKQHVQSPKSFEFYDVLKRLAASETVFSQVQPGTLKANINRTDGTDETVLGFIETASISEKRIYFSFADIYPGEELPPFPYNCDVLSAPEDHVSYCDPSGGGPNLCPQSVIERVNLGLITYSGNNSADIGTCPGPDTFVPRVCGDCLILGENTPPDFWEE